VSTDVSTLKSRPVHGGPRELAWESGLLAGLAERGADVSGADFLLGTSAGSVVGALLALGHSPAALVEPLLKDPSAASEGTSARQAPRA
jgi:NTE family protein